MKITDCRSCGEAIIWAKSKNGKAMPIDAEPTVAGKFMLHEGKPDEIDAFYDPRYAGDRYTCHFETCANADQHRRER